MKLVVYNLLLTKIIQDLFYQIKNIMKVLYPLCPLFSHFLPIQRKIMSSLQQQFYLKYQVGLLYFSVYTLHNTEEVHAPESMLSTLDSHKEKQPNLHNLVLAGAKDRGDQFILTHRYLVHSKKIYWVDAKAASCFLCLSTHSQVSYTK